MGRSMKLVPLLQAVVYLGYVWASADATVTPTAQQPGATSSVGKTPDTTTTPTTETTATETPAAPEATDAPATKDQELNLMLSKTKRMFMNKAPGPSLTIDKDVVDQALELSKTATDFLGSEEGKKIEEAKRKNFGDQLKSANENISRAHLDWSTHLETLGSGFDKLKECADAQKSTWEKIKPELQSKSAFKKLFGLDKAQRAGEAEIHEDDRVKKDMFDTIIHQCNTFYEKEQPVDKLLRQKSVVLNAVKEKTTANDKKKIIADITKATLLGKRYHVLHQYYLTPNTITPGKIQYELGKTYHLLINFFANLDSTEIYQRQKTEADTGDAKEFAAGQKEINRLYTKSISYYIPAINYQALAIVHTPTNNAEYTKVGSEITSFYSLIQEKIRTSGNSLKMKAWLTASWSQRLKTLETVHTSLVKAAMSALSANPDTGMIKETLEATKQLPGNTKATIDLTSPNLCTGREVHAWFADPNANEGEWGGNAVMNMIRRVGLYLRSVMGRLSTHIASVFADITWSANLCRGLLDNEKDTLQQIAHRLDKIGSLLQNLSTVLFMSSEYKNAAYIDIDAICKDRSGMYISFLLWSKVGYIRRTKKIAVPEFSYTHEAANTIQSLSLRDKELEKGALVTYVSKPDFLFQEPKTVKVLTVVNNVVEEYIKSIKGLPETICSPDSKAFFGSGLADLHAVASAHVCAKYFAGDSDKSIASLSKFMDDCVAATNKKIERTNFVEAISAIKNLDTSFITLTSWLEEGDKKAAVGTILAEHQTTNPSTTIDTTARNVVDANNVIQADLTKFVSGVNSIFYQTEAMLHAFDPKYPEPIKHQEDLLDKAEAAITKPPQINKPSDEEEEAATLPTETAATTEKGFFSEHGWLIAIIVLAVLGGLGVGGYFYYQKKQAAAETS
ncbi:hypothetical protein NEHOM01_0613 [Nematocida homosporus]|uniref:uncharacterized protein n=1 Tax=Nematocida homosporus TaxID=1912981 RepID=UPI0022209126|nr:uncharacterized protein NEHOM01_0613 [Nematocida homosporus]KAI5185108.1 hypothetical protein NEHOM01_0613 [Nematocida homosporus]